MLARKIASNFLMVCGQDGLLCAHTENQPQYCLANWQIIMFLNSRNWLSRCERGKNCMCAVDRVEIPKKKEKLFSLIPSGGVSYIVRRVLRAGNRHKDTNVFRISIDLWLNCFCAI